MKKGAGLRTISPLRLWSLLPQLETSHLPDALMFAAAIALFYGVLVVARTWFGPLTPSVEISRSPWALPAYAGYSLLRIGIAYFLSLVFTLVYGYVAAYNPRAERFMIPLLDVLQSIPVLSFLPGVMLAMVALFPGRQLGVELGAILLIFTGQVWNMAFSFYASLKSIPNEMREAAAIYRFSWWQRFTQMELPFSAIGLVWNSMMSVAGGWFALMVCEMFVLGQRDFRLPGLGSYLQTAASAGEMTSILWGVVTMVLLIVLLDQFVWRPVIAWAEKFKVEQVESTDARPSPCASTCIRRFRRGWSGTGAPRCCACRAALYGGCAPPAARWGSAKAFISAPARRGERSRWFSAGRCRPGASRCAGRFAGSRAGPSRTTSRRINFLGMKIPGIRPRRIPLPGISRPAMAEAVWLAAVGVATGLLACLMTRLLIPLLAHREILDRPNERSSHRVPTPRGGGIAVIGSVLLAWTVLARTELLPSCVFGIILAAVLLAAVSWLDDLRGLSPLVRLLAQAVAVAIGTFVLPEPRDLFYLAAIGLVWIWWINLFNFMDGIDGLAGSEAAAIGAGLLLFASVGAGTEPAP